MLDAYSLLNLSVNWEEMFGTALDLSFFGTNMLDREYVVFSSGGYSSVGIDSRQMGLPRMYGARLRYNFGG